MKVLLYSVNITLAVLSLTTSNILAANMALQLDGKTYLEIADSKSLNPKKAITIEAWMKMESKGGECLAKDWGGQRDYIFPELIDGTKIRFVLWPQTKILDAPGLVLKKWQHHAGVWDGKEMRVYIDGKEVGASPYNVKELNDSKASLYIGVGDSAKWTCTGLIDEIRIWEVARTEKEINDFMAKTLMGDEPGLNAHYTFDKKNADDNTANKNNGKKAAGTPKYIDVTKDLNLEPLSVGARNKLATTWARIKQSW